MQRLYRVLRIILFAGGALAIIIAVGAALLWRNPRPLHELDWPVAPASFGTDSSRNATVTVTWLGVSNLLFDDGETQILIDGTFTRISPFEIVTLRPVSSDFATVNQVLADYRINALAAIVPVHSHFDHALDVGAVANRTSAVVLGSESTANIARGAGLPVEQYQILASGESRQFGRFTITMIDSLHAPVGIGDKPWFAGSIAEPLVQPARVSAWKEGGSYSIVLSHPNGSTLVQGSAGFVADRLAGQSVDVVMLGVAGLGYLGRDHVTNYWKETVSTTGAGRVFVIHQDDFTRPFGDVSLFPKLLDDMEQTAVWLNETAAATTPSIVIEQLPFGEAVRLY